MTIKVLYTCNSCGLVDVPVEVKARTTEDVKEWMDMAILALCDDHHRRSPNCYPKEFTYVKVPITGASKIGGAMEH